MRLPLWLGMPSAGIGGYVYVSRHQDPVFPWPRYIWAVNHLSDSGTGWQSPTMHDPELARTAAEVLAECLGAELVGEHFLDVTAA